MSVILILILASLAVALAFLAGFIWAVKAGQFEDTTTPAMRILSEDEAAPEEAFGPSSPEAGRVSPRAASAVTRTRAFEPLSTSRGALGETRPAFTALKR